MPRYSLLGPGSASVASNTTVNYSDERDKVYIVYYSTFVCHRFCADEHKFSCVSSFNQSYMYAHSEYFQKYMFHLLYMYLLLWSDTMSFVTNNFNDVVVYLFSVCF